MEKERKKITVSPDNLEEWLSDNPEKIYRRSLKSSESIIDSNYKISEDLLLEFEWENSTYAKIYLKKGDIEPALNKSINYFVQTELYEEAQKAKNILDRFLEGGKK